MTPAEECKLINSLIGKPWAQGAEGPDEYDCGGLAVMLQRELMHRNVPSILSPPKEISELVTFVKEHPLRKYYKRVDKPVHGCIVEMAHNLHPFHIGIYLKYDGGGIIHSAEKTGVVFNSILDLTTLLGWRSLYYYDWAG